IAHSFINHSLMLSGFPISGIQARSLHDALPIYTEKSLGKVKAIVSTYDNAYQMGVAEWHRFKEGAFADADGTTVPLFWQHNHSRSEEHTSELQSRENLVCRLLLENKKTTSSRVN